VNARTNLITVILALSLIGPATAGAGVRSIPWDAPLSKQPAVHLHTLKAKSAATLGTYNEWAYVNGGASPKVAKAITAAARTHGANGGTNGCASTAKYRLPC
jgi:hypothetical protein